MALSEELNAMIYSSLNNHDGTVMMHFFLEVQNPSFEKMALKPVYSVQKIFPCARESFRGFGK